MVASAAAPALAAEADLVLRGGAVYTLDPARSRAQAIAVEDGRVVAVGTDADMAPWIGAQTEVVELGGRMVLPGFHDSHAHPIAGGMQELSCSLVESRTVDAILAKVRECAGATASSVSVGAITAAARATRGGGERWLVGGGWDLSLFPAANPHRAQLDAVVPDRPVFLEGADGHSAWVNSKALALAGVDRSTPDPPGGVIERDRSTGEPTGTLRESAAALVSSKLPPPTAEDRRAGLMRALQTAASFGITALIDPVTSEDDFATYQQAEAAGELTARVLACAQPRGAGAGVHGSTSAGPPARVDGEEDDAGVDLAARGIDALERLRRRERPASDRLRAGCLKIFVDGVLEGETAALLAPYLGRGDQRGMLNIEPQALAEAVTRWDAQGIQVHFHVIGDRAARVALDAIEAARRANGARDTRHHLAHLQLVDPADVGRFATLDATATFQALWAYPDTYIRDVNLGQVGPDRVARMYPIGSIHRAGGRIAAGSDWPVSSMNPLLAIEVALTRQDPAGRGSAPAGADDDAATLNAGERLDLDTMLAAFTVEGAWLMRQEKLEGTIEIGKRADLVVLGRDLFAIAPADIGEVRVERTIVGGRTVYSAAD